MQPRTSEAEHNCVAGSVEISRSSRPLRTSPPLSTSPLIGEIRTVELLAESGSSRVWRAVDATGRSLALKTLQTDLSRQPGAAQLLRHEHAVLVELRHEHIVDVFGLVQFRGAPALAMEYLGGGDLVSLTAAHPRHWIGAVSDLLAALTQVHAHGYAHRDVKARNVLFDEHNRVRLIDFASADRFGNPQRQGGTTAAYRPKDGSRALVGAHDDVFAFAALLYELLFGRLPFEPDSEPALKPVGRLMQPASEPAPEVRPLVDLVLRTLAADDARACGSLSVFGDVIESVTAGYL